MNYLKLSLLAVLLLAAGCNPLAPAKPQPAATNEPASGQTPTATGSPSANTAETAVQPAANGLYWPVSDAFARVTKKPFGIYVSPGHSPVSPERFTGYHTGADFETFSAQQNSDVPVYAICDGKLLLKKWASGYGGVAVQSCTIDNQAVTVIYGHLRQSSILPAIGQSLGKGQQFAVLGTGYTQETDGERKHLHLGIHKGTSANILGYVQNKAGLAGWIDPLAVLQ